MSDQREALQELLSDLRKKAQECRSLSGEYKDEVNVARCLGKASAYEHAAERLAAILKQDQPHA
jgi:hypothetical protein